MVKVKDVELNKKFDSFFMVKNCQVKQTASGSSYMDLVLSDESGDIVAKLWDLNDDVTTQVREGTLVKVRAMGNKWQEQTQLKIESIRPVKDDDGVNAADFVPSAPQDAGEMYKFITGYGEKIKDKELKEIVLYILKEKKDRLMIFPAALKNHHAVRSGLLYHISTMLKAGEKLAEVYTYLNTDLLFAGIILHDMAKLDEIEVNDLGMATDYTTEGMLLGHLIQGLKVIEDAAAKVKISKKKILLLKHMIVSHHSEPEFGSPRRPMFPEAEMLHYLDIMDARMYDMNKAKNSIEIGEFSDRVWTLDNRKVYNVNLSE